MIGCVKPIPKILALTAFLTLPGCASVMDLEDALAVVPYNIDNNGRIVVEARVNGHGPYDFVLDTGASISAVFGPLRNELALEPIPGRWVTVHGFVTSGKHSLLDIDRLDIGTETWAMPRIVSLPGETAAGAGIDGVLGVDFMRRYALGFFTGDRVVRLYSPDLIARRTYQGWASVPFKSKSIGDSGAAFYYFDAELDGWKLTAVFDLGAGFNIINWPGVLSLGRTSRRLRKNTLLSGALESSRVAARIEADEVTTANVRWRDESFYVANVKIFETFMLSDKPAAILGAGLFTQRDFVIDFARNRLLVKVAMDEVNLPGSTGASPEN